MQHGFNAMPVSMFGTHPLFSCLPDPGGNTRVGDDPLEYFIELFRVTVNKYLLTWIKAFLQVSDIIVQYRGAATIRLERPLIQSIENMRLILDI